MILVNAFRVFTGEAEAISNESLFLFVFLNIPSILLSDWALYTTLEQNLFFPPCFQVFSGLCSPLTLTTFYQGHFVLKIIYYTCHCPTLGLL